MSAAGRVLVTGAGGRIGTAVVAELVARGTAVTALVLDAADAPAGADRVVAGDAADADVVARALEGADGVVHLAAIPSPLHDPPEVVFGSNTLATFTVLEQAGRAGVRRAVVAGSQARSGLPFAPRPGHPAYVPADLASPSQAADPYALSKLVDEQTAGAAARRHGMTVVVLRYPLVGDADRLAAFAAARASDPALGASDLWAYLDVRDAATAAALALDVEEPGAHVVDVAAPETLVPFATRDLLARYHPGTEVRADLPGRTVPVDLAPAERLLGFRARHLLDPGPGRPLP
ncbi:MULTISPECIES: NAD-dependent epimerase/dehydratase family protein [unclassified Isoptericola]|uniref:NAD-dependent epimerase/dehydratase family protein n=1 Tax=unclassified Isoptericola TaxID=2623355 RepID=UPI00365C1C7F